MDRLYPNTPSVTDAKWGGQTFPDGYTPIALDSEASARARMIVALRAGKSDAVARSDALAGSDEAGTVKRILAELLTEQKTLAAVPVDEEAKYRAAIAAKAKHLDVDTWVAAKKAALGGTLEAVKVESVIAEK